MRTALVIPSLGGPHLESCLAAAAALEPAPDEATVVLSGVATERQSSDTFEVLRCRRRLGFAAAVNAGLAKLSEAVDAVAIINDDATPEPDWLGVLVDALRRNAKVAAVQGTVVSGDGSSIDGRGIVFDRYGLPVQIDRGRPVDRDRGERPVLAISGTAGLFRMKALREAALSQSEIFDPRFGSYHEDLDLGLRLHRLGRRALWTGGARVAHLGSASGPALRWRHPWWVLANRWRALAGNLSPPALVRALPRLLRGEIRAARALSRENRRAVPVAAVVAFTVPLLVVGGWLRQTPGPRLEAIPEGRG